MGSFPEFCCSLQRNTGFDFMAGRLKIQVQGRDYERLNATYVCVTLIAGAVSREARSNPDDLYAYHI